MQVKSIAECSKGSILQYFRLSLSYHSSLISLFCQFFRSRFTQVLLYMEKIKFSLEMSKFHLPCSLRPSRHERTSAIFQPCTRTTEQKCIISCTVHLHFTLNFSVCRWSSPSGVESSCCKVHLTKYLFKSGLIVITNTDRCD